MTAPEDPARWTVDDELPEPLVDDLMSALSWALSVDDSDEAQDYVHDIVRTIQPFITRELARVHEGCTHTTDTLPSEEDVYQWVMRHDHESIAYPTRHTYMAVIKATLEAVADLLEAEGPDHG